MCTKVGHLGSQTNTQDASPPTNQGDPEGHGKVEAVAENVGQLDSAESQQPLCSLRLPDHLEESFQCTIGALTSAEAREYRDMLWRRQSAIS